MTQTLQQLLKSDEIDLMMTPFPWHQISHVYQEQHRRYHDTQHIHDLLRQIDQIDMGEDQREWLSGVAWLHDAYYDPKAKHGVNETKSASILQGPLGHVFTPAGKKLAVQTILSTAQHTQDQQGLHPLTQVFLDIDLAGLGQDYNEFLRQREKIKQEYLLSGIDEELFLRGTANFYQMMLQRQQIYYTELFSSLEKTARLNLEQGLQHTLIDIQTRFPSHASIKRKMT